jgi:hypothetical protein
MYPNNTGFNASDKNYITVPVGVFAVESGDNECTLLVSATEGEHVVFGGMFF